MSSKPIERYVDGVKEESHDGGKSYEVTENHRPDGFPGVRPPLEYDSSNARTDAPKDVIEEQIEAENEESDLPDHDSGSDDQLDEPTTEGEDESATEE